MLHMYILRLDATDMSSFKQSFVDIHPGVADRMDLDRDKKIFSIGKRGANVVKQNNKRLKCDHGQLFAPVIGRRTRGT
jgi:hypothetical protein